MTKGRKIDDTELVEISGGMDGGLTEPQQDDVPDSVAETKERDGGGGGGGGMGFDVTGGSDGTTGVQQGD